MTFLRYGLVQIAAYGIDMGGFLLLIAGPGLGPVVANVGAKIAAGCFAFVAHRHFTFAAPAASAMPRQALRYFALLALNVPLSSALLALLLRVIAQPAVAKFTGDVLLVAATYWVSKLLVFRIERSSMPPGPAP